MYNLRFGPVALACLQTWLIKQEDFKLDTQHDPFNGLGEGNQVVKSFASKVLVDPDWWVSYKHFI